MTKKESAVKNNVDYSELVEYLDKKFIQDAHEHKEMIVEIKNLHVEFNDLQTAVDAYAKKADAYFQEMVMLSHKVDRHEKWLQRIAEKVGVKLDY